MGDLQAAERWCAAPDSGAEYCDDRVCVFVCLRAYLRHPIFTKLFMYVTYAHAKNQLDSFNCSERTPTCDRRTQAHG